MPKPKSGRISLLALPIAACALIVGVLLAGTSLFLRPERSEPDAVVLVGEIQRLGQLHTVRYNLKDVVEHERALAPRADVGAQRDRYEHSRGQGGCAAPPVTILIGLQE